MSSGIDDPYKGADPSDLWTSRWGSDQGGFRELNPDGTRTDSWDYQEQLLAGNNMGTRMQGKRVIEIGSGANVDFRDYCVRNGASEYVGVDLFDVPSKPPTQLGETAIRYVKDDVLRFLAQQSADSAIIAGFFALVDEMLPQRNCERHGLDIENIMDAIAREVYRVVIPGEHFMVNSSSGILFKRLRMAGFLIKDWQGILWKPDKAVTLLRDTPELRSFKRGLEIEFSRHVPAEYQDVIAGARFCAVPGANYSSHISLFAFDCDNPQELQGGEKELVAKPLTKRGAALEPFINGKDFIDLGCGAPTYSLAPRVLARRLGARRYMGVDAEFVNPKNFDWTPETVREVSKHSITTKRYSYDQMDRLGTVTRAEVDGGFSRCWIDDDILAFVSKMEKSQGTVFFLAGIQVKNDKAKSHLSLLAKEIGRVARAGDVVIVTSPERIFTETLQSHRFINTASLPGNEKIAPKGTEIFVRQP